MDKQIEKLNNNLKEVNGNISIVKKSIEDLKLVLETLLTTGCDNKEQVLNLLMKMEDRLENLKNHQKYISNNIKIYQSKCKHDFELIKQGPYNNMYQCKKCNFISIY